MLVSIPVHGSAQYEALGPSARIFLVKDINPGLNESYPSGFLEYNERVYFTAKNAGGVYEVWYSDGSALGTGLLKEIHPEILRAVGILGTYFSEDLASQVLLFLADDGQHGIEVWQTDGTTGGTKLLKDINPDGDSNPWGFHHFGQVSYFRATDSTGLHLWRTDGTPDGTVKLTTSPIDDSRCMGSKSDGIIFQGEFYFPANYGLSGCTLFRTNGIAGPVQPVEQTGTVPVPYFRPDDLTVLGNTLFFSADAEELGRELWAVDGTTGKADLFLDINPGSYVDSDPYELMNFQSQLVFSATYQYETRLWVSDGSPAGTHAVPAASDLAYYSQPAGKTAFGDLLIFQARDTDHGVEIFKFDGTQVSLVKDIVEGGCYPDCDSRAHDFAVLGDQVLFGANSVAGYPNDNELWRTDGTPEGTVRIADIRPGSESSGPLDMFPSGNKIFFTADDGIHGRELWVYMLLPYSSYLPSVFQTQK